MYRVLFLIGIALSTISLAQAQGQTTVIRQQGDQVQVIQTPNPVEAAFNRFEEADANGNGRIERSEARNAGILGFEAAGGSKGYLTREEYQAAATATDLNTDE